MFDTGDDLTEESYRVPWLIWIQLLVLFLLFALLFFFALFPSDPTTDTTPSISSDAFLLHHIHQIHKPLPNHDSTPTLSLTNPRQQGGQNLLTQCERATGPSLRMEEIEEEEEDDDDEEEVSSLHSHPCHYFQLATVAFLKCFGLDSTSDSPSTRKLRKRKES